MTFGQKTDAEVHYVEIFRTQGSRNHHKRNAQERNKNLENLKIVFGNIADLDSKNKSRTPSMH